MHIYIDDNSNPMEELQLPADFHPELSRTNPFLTDEGSQSIPLTLPASDHNLNLLGFLYRTTSSKRPKKKIQAIVADGASWMRGTLYIEQANKLDGIECTFYTSEGQLYEKIKDYKLRDLDWPTMIGVGQDYAGKAISWMNKFLKIIQGEAAQPEEYFICNVWSESEFYVGDPKQGDHFMLNELSSKNNVLSFYAMEEQKYYEEDNDDATEITAPVGFGITPFLRLGYVLRHMFDYFGYILDVNMFDTNESLKRIILLNNVADAIVDGNIYLKQLLPNVSVEDFLNAVRIKFGLEFIQKGDHVYINTWDENLQRYPDLDLSPFVRDYESYIPENKKALSLEFQALTNQPDYRHTRAVEYEKQKNEALLTHSSPSGFEKESLDISDKTPYYYQGLSGYMKQDGMIGYLKSLRTLFINKVQYRNSNLVINGEPDDENGEDMDIAFCFSDDSLSTFDYGAGRQKKYIAARNISDYLSLFATNAVDREGNIIYGNNVYEVLYKSRDMMLRKANQQILFAANIPVYIISTMDISTPKIIKGQKVLIERIDYVLGRPDLCQITARTLHQYPED